MANLTEQEQQEVIRFIEPGKALPATDTTTAFLATANGKTMRFRAADAMAHRLVDLETRLIWNAYGSCLAPQNE